MAQSTITSKYQTTVPKEIRERLSLKPKDVLRWELVEGEVRVTLTRHRFLDWRGTISVGSGSPVQDVRRARALRGNEPS